MRVPRPGRRTVLRAGAAAVGIQAALVAGYAFAATTSISLAEGGPRPANVTIAWGDAVSFANAASEAMTVRIPRVTTESPSIAPGGSWSYTFDGHSNGSYFFQQVGRRRSYGGQIVVRITGSVTLKRSSKKYVVYGRTSTLSGTSSVRGSPVTISHRPSGQNSAWRAVATATPAADGSFSSVLKPLTSGAYRAGAAADQVLSEPVRVDVAPLLRLVSAPRAVRAGAIIAVRARIAPANAARVVELAQHKRGRGWQSVAAGRVTRTGTVVLRWRAAAGRSRLRLEARYGSIRRGFVPGQGAPFVVLAR